MKKNEWVKIPWDGNPELGFFCYRKKFGRGHVSVGIGEFDGIYYSYEANSEHSIGSTRWRANGKTISEQEAMDMVDKNNGKWKNRHG